MDAESANSADTVIYDGKDCPVTGNCQYGDGKAMTITGTGTNAEGQPINSVSVYDTQ